ncbi:MAG: DUF748 domain-containing protein [Limisphaerales bacterium]
MPDSEPPGSRPSSSARQDDRGAAVRSGSRLGRFWASRGGRAGGVLVALLLVYAGATGILLPWILRSQAQARLSALAGGPVTIDAIRFAPFSWKLRIKGFRLGAPDGTPILTWSNLLVDAEFASVWRRELYLRAVELEGWDIRVARMTNGAVNLLQLGERVLANLPKSPDEPQPPPTTNQALAPLTVDRVVIAPGRVEVVDHVPSGGFSAVLDPIDLRISGLGTRAASPAEIQFSARGDRGERMEWNGNLGLAGKTLEGVFRLGGTPVSRGRPYLDPYSPILVTNGVLELALPFRVGWASTPLEVTVKDASFVIRDLASKEQATGEDFAGATEVSLSGVRASLAERSAGIGYLRIRGLWLQARRRAGEKGEAETNLRGVVEPEVIDSLIADLTDWQLALDRVELQAGKLTYTDTLVSPGVSTGLEEVELVGEGLSNRTNAEPFTLRTSVRWGQAGVIRTDGEAQFFPTRARLGVEVSDVALDPGGPYLEQFVRLTLNRATLNAKLEATYGRREGTGSLVGVSGNLGVSDLAATESGTASDFIRWNEVALNGVSVGIDPNRLMLDELAVRGLETSLVMMTNGQLNVLALIRETQELSEGKGGGDGDGGGGGSASGSGSGESAGAPRQETPNGESKDSDSADSGGKKDGDVGPGEPTPGSPAGGDAPPFWEQWPIRLGQLKLSEVALFARDNHFGEGFRTQIESLDGDVRDLELPAKGPATVDLKGRLSASSGFELTGTIQPDPAHFATDLRLEVRNTDLKQFTPYTLRFAGHPVVDGRLTADVRYKVDGDQLEAENKIALDRFTLGDKVPSPDAVDLPLKMGVALLKDSDGRIALDVPLSGTLSDPEFSVAPVIWQVVRNILLKAVTAPFKLLGSVFGGSGDEELEYVEFEPGRSDISPAQSNRLATLQRALKGRPQLTLVIVPSFDGILDTRAAASELLESRLRSLRVEEIGASGAPIPDAAGVQLSPEDRSRLIRTAYLRDFGALPSAAVETNAAPGAVAGAAPLESVGTAQAVDTGKTNAVDAASRKADGTAGEKPDREARPELAPVADPLERRLLETLRVPPETLQALARRRGEAVRDALVADGTVPAERLKLEAVDAAMVGEGETRVRFRLE